jgi:trehalose synthase
MMPPNRPATDQGPLTPVMIDSHLMHVPVVPVSPGLFRQVLSFNAYRDLSAAIVQARTRLAGKVIWNINSTARGGGVAEMLQSMVAYACGAGIDTRWVVVQGQSDFFRITKRIHNQIQGFAGDGGELGDLEHEEYERSLAQAGRELALLLRPGDIVLLHDPQTAGLAPELKDTGVKIVWRCHVGVDSPNELAARAWDFLTRYLTHADTYVFSRPTYAWKGLQHEKVVIIPPSIDPFTPKNNLLTTARVGAILINAGLMSGYAAATPYYVRASGSIGLIARRAEVFEVAQTTAASRLVTQVSRWDRLKDPIGVLRGFLDFVPPSTAAHLVLAGPEVAAVSDDPEGAEVLEEIVSTWRALPETARQRIHLACLPMQDLDENAAIVNALQRRSEVVVQKSLVEGFGLTVSEAMWKARPVVASAIGGIQDQIQDGKSGLLLPDPSDLKAFGAAVTRLLAEPSFASEIGMEAQERVRENYLNDRHLRQYADLFSMMVA